MQPWLRPCEAAVVSSAVHGLLCLQLPLQGYRDGPASWRYACLHTLLAVLALSCPLQWPTLL